ncbi:hypothetical protein SAMN05519103_00746 [Rhizobiales bacterium GAS113]|nr:hypothetical protein SAMN05519103_00746 [Rhizobiales bacterium GAS113]
MGFFDSSSSSITVAVDVLFPSNVTSGPGIAVNKTNSVWSVNVDIVDLTENTSISTPSGYFVMVWDTALARLEKVRLDNLNLPTLVDFRSPIGDANYSVLVTDRYVGLTATLNAIRTITLPAAATVPAGRQVVIQDEVGGVSSSFYHSIVPTGADTINGGGSWIQKTTRGGVIFRSNGSNAWNVLVPFQRTAVADANYTATFGDSLIAYTSITAARTVTLPAAASYQKGAQLTIIDESGSCSATNTIGITRAGADTINGGTSLTLNQAYAYVALESDGVSKWTIVDSSVPLTASAILSNRASLGIDSHTSIGDANYAALTTDYYIATTVALTAARTITLPAANSVPPGREIVINDEKGGVTATNTLTIARAGADTVNGGTSFVIDRAFQGISLRSNGTNAWAFGDPAGPIDGTVIGGTTPAAGTFTTLAATSMDNTPVGQITPAAGTFTNLTLTSGALSVGGRLTLTSATPILTGTVTAVGTVYFTPYLGDAIPLWNGTQFVWTAVAELSNILANSAVGNAGPSAAAASQVYDLYVWNNAGVPTLTRSPAWSVGGGSNTARGGGAGSAQQQRFVVGVIVNQVAITNGPAATFGTYVGMIATDSGGGTVTWNLGSSAAGGGAATLNVWNMFNRVSFKPAVNDSTASHTYTSGTIRALDASNTNRITFVRGLEEDGVSATLNSAIKLAANGAQGTIYIGLDSTTAAVSSSTTPTIFATASVVFSSAVARFAGYTGLGAHYLQALEGSDGVNANIFFTGAFMLFEGDLRC